MWLSFRPGYESTLLKSFVLILILYSLIGPIAEGKPSSLGSSQILIISLHFALAAGILPCIVSVILATEPSSCILSPKYFSAVEFCRMFSWGYFPSVMMYTAVPMLIDDASAAAKLPCPITYIIVALSVSPAGHWCQDRNSISIIQHEPHSVVVFCYFFLCVHCV